MINTIYELLSSLKDKGIVEIASYLNIQHNSTIGDMDTRRVRHLFYTLKACEGFGVAGSESLVNKRVSGFWQ